MCTNFLKWVVQYWRILFEQLKRLHLWIKSWSPASAKLFTLGHTEIIFSPLTRGWDNLFQCPLLALFWFARQRESAFMRKKRCGSTMGIGIRCATLCYNDSGCIACNSMVVLCYLRIAEPFTWESRDKTQRHTRINGQTMRIWCPSNGKLHSS